MARLIIWSLFVICTVLPGNQVWAGRERSIPLVPLFDTPIGLYESTRPNALVFEDFNGDGATDLAAGFGYSNSELMILAGNGNWAFHMANRYLCDSIQDIVLLDCNGDPFVDLAVIQNYGTYYNGRVRIFLGTGDASLTDGGTATVGAGPLSAVAHDFNSDGWPDLAVVNYASESISVLLNMGNGTFDLATELAAGREPTALVFSDFDQNGRADLAVTNSGDDSVALFSGAGDGSFTPLGALHLAGEPCAPCASDFDHDGKVDLAVALKQTNGIAVLRGVGGGDFAPPDFYSAGERPCSMAIEDFNGDGSRDIAALNCGDDTVSLLLGRGDASFNAPSIIELGYDADRIFACDVNRNGLPDFVVLRQMSNEILLFRGNGDGTFVQPREIPSAGPHTNITRGDFNDDGAWDAVAYGGPNAQVFIGDGAGGMTPENPFDPGDVFGSGIIVADLDADGFGDLIFSSLRDSMIQIRLGHGDGSFQPPLSYHPGDFFARIIRAGDFNVDGCLDLAAVLRSPYWSNADQHRLLILAGSGDGTFTESDRINIEGLFAGDLLPMDANLDGRTDLISVVVSPELGLAAYLGKGDGTFRSPNVLWAGRGVSSASCAAADFNNDGAPDVVISAFPGNVLICQGFGDGSFCAGAEYPLGDGLIAAGDFNGDGLPDIVRRYQDAVAFSPGAGGGTLNGTLCHALPRGLSEFVHGDLNGDGLWDLAVPQSVSSSLAILLNRTQSAGIPAPPLNLRAVPQHGAVALSWQEAPGASTYRIYFGHTAGGPYGETAEAGASTSFVISSLTPGQTYFFVVTASNAHGESGPSNEAAAVPLPTETATIDLQLNQGYFVPDALFQLTSRLMNFGPAVDAVECIALAAFGEYYFWPDWGHYPESGVQFEPAYLDPGETRELVILELVWPHAAGEASGMTFYGALLTRQSLALLSFDQVEFGFGQ